MVGRAPLAGASFLLANNPSRIGPPLSFGELARFALVPLAAGVAAAAAGAGLFAIDAFGLRPIAEEIVGRADAPRFLVVWGIHAGSYLGAVVGAILAVALIRRRRRSRAGSVLI